MSDRTIEINSNCKAISGLKKRARLIAKQVLDEMLPAYEGALELSILITNDKTIQSLNKQYRKKDKPTNVLSFPQEQLSPKTYQKSINKHPYFHLGDIIISQETIKTEAGQQEKSLEAHFTHMLIHGLLHLLGFDHIKKADQVQMEGIEIAILKKFDINSPYI